MPRLLVIPVVAAVWAACQCGGSSNLCEGTSCGPGLTCEKSTGRCVFVVGTGGGLSGAGGGFIGTGGGESAGGSAGGEVDAGNVPCPMTCAGNAPICDRTQGRCVACTETQGCSFPNPVCNRLWQGGLGRCQVCLDDHSGCSGATPFCDVTIVPTAGCIGCRSSADCTQPGTVCDTANTRSCVGNDGGFGGGSSGGGVIWGDGGVTAHCLSVNTPTPATCTTECPKGYTCQGGRCVLRGSTGPIQVTLRFRDDEDLDLYVVEPLPDGGTCEVFYQQPNVDAGPPPIPLPFPLPTPVKCGAKGWLDLDSNAACRIDRVNVENIIYSPGVTPWSGRYVVRVNYWQNCMASGMVPYEVEVRANGQTRYFCGNFTPSQASGGGLGAGRFVADFVIP